MVVERSSIVVVQRLRIKIHSNLIPFPIPMCTTDVAATACAAVTNVLSSPQKPMHIGSEPGI